MENSSDQYWKIKIPNTDGNPLNQTQTRKMKKNKKEKKEKQQTKQKYEIIIKK